MKKKLQRPVSSYATVTATCLKEEEPIKEICLIPKEASSNEKAKFPTWKDIQNFPRKYTVGLTIEEVTKLLSEYSIDETKILTLLSNKPRVYVDQQPLCMIRDIFNVLLTSLEYRTFLKRQNLLVDYK